MDQMLAGTRGCISPKVKFLILCCVWMPFVACSTRYYLRAFPLPSNPELLDRAFRIVAKKVAENPLIQKGRSYGIFNMELSEGKDDYPVKVVVEDMLKETLVSKGARVVERDEDVMLHLIFEDAGSRVTSILTDPLKINIYDRIFSLLENPESSRCEALSLLNDLKVYRESFQRGKKGHDAVYLGPSIRDKLASSTLVVPEYLIAYRVYTAGVRMYDDDTSDAFITREARVELFVEIVETKTGIVLWAGRIKGEVNDKIPYYAAEQTDSSGFVFYTHAFPLVEEARDMHGDFPVVVIQYEEKAREGREPVGEVEEGVVEKEVVKEGTVKTITFKGSARPREKPLKKEVEATGEVRRTHRPYAPLGIVFGTGFISGISFLQATYKGKEEIDMFSYGVDARMGYRIGRHIVPFVFFSHSWSNMNWLRVGAGASLTFPIKNLIPEADLKIGYIRGKGPYTKGSFYIAPGGGLKFMFMKDLGVFIDMELGIHQVYRPIEESFLTLIGGLLNISLGALVVL